MYFVLVERIIINIVDCIVGLAFMSDDEDCRKKVSLFKLNKHKMNRKSVDTFRLQITAVIQV